MKHRGEILNLKKEEMLTSDGKIKYPLVSYQEFIENWLSKDITDERERQHWYKKEIKKSHRLYEKYFPDFKIPKGENAALIAQGIRPIEEHGRVIEYKE